MNYPEYDTADPELLPGNRRKTVAQDPEVGAHDE